VNDRDAVQGALYAMELADEEELARVDALSAEAIARELEADGIRREDFPDVDALLRKGRADVPVVAMAAAGARQPTSWVVPLIAAALGAVAAVVGIRSAPQSEAWRHGPVKAPEHAPPIETAPPAPPVSPAVPAAAALRAEASRACNEHLWGACEQRLNDARILDPEGEDTDEVQAMRRQIVGMRPVPYGAKPH
jgi:hypothetical protein